MFSMFTLNFFFFFFNRVTIFFGVSRNLSSWISVSPVRIFQRGRVSGAFGVRSYGYR